MENKNILIIILTLCFQLGFSQPGNMIINQDVGGVYGNTTLTLKGAVFQARFQENGNGTISGTRNWQFNSDDYSNTWGATSNNTLSAYNTTIIPNSNTASGNWTNSCFPNCYNTFGKLPATQPNKYYTYNILKGVGYASQNMSVLETSYNPVNLTAVNQIDSSFGSRSVTITTSAIPNAEEYLFIRYSTDGYLTSTLLQTAGANTTWSATIPWQSGVVSFYVYSSNRIFATINSDIVTYGQSVHDTSMLNINNNGGINYSWTPVQGKFIVNSSGGSFINSTAFNSLTLAGGVFAALNTAALGTGSVTILVTADSNAETGAIALNSSTNWTSINLQPNGNRTISGAPNAGTPLIDFNGADKVTFNGLNSENKALTISNTTASAVQNTSTFRYINGAQSNTITKCTVLGSFSGAVTTNGGTILYATDPITQNGNDNNTVSFCTIGPAGINLPTKAISSLGSVNSTTNNNSSITIDSNNIYDFFGASVTSGGVYVDAGNTNWIVTRNNFYQTATRTQTSGSQHSSIWLVGGAGNGFDISSNKIGFSFYPAATGTGALTAGQGTGKYTFIGLSSSRFSPISLNVGATTVTNVQGNTISDIALSGALLGTGNASPLKCISIEIGLVNVGNLTGNTIGSLTTTGNITFNSNVDISQAEINGICYFGASNFVSSNNLIGGISASNSGSGCVSFFGLRNNSSSGVTWICDNNTIGGSIVNSIISNSTNFLTIVNGILNSAPSSTITNNTIKNLSVAGGTGSSNSASMIGICNHATNANHTLSQNTIYNLTNTNPSDSNVVTGIHFNASSGTNSIEKNNIYKLTSATNNSSSEINGIRVGGGTATYKNNMIAIGTNVSRALSINGINEPLVGTNNYYHNSIFIDGVATSGTSNSFAFNSTQITVNRNIRNNIFVNMRSNSGATGTNYIIKVGGSSANPVGLNLNTNIYFGSTFGFFNNVTSSTFAAWKTAVGQDVQSFNSDPRYINPSAATPDLHINPLIATNVEGSGVEMGVINDFDNEIRSTLSPVDIGADAGNFTSVIPVCTTPSNQPSNFTNGINTFSSIAGSFSAANGLPSGYLVVRSIGALNSNPVNGVVYSIADILGNGTIIQMSNTLNFSQINLASNTNYTITIFSYNNTGCSGGPKYLVSNPLIGNLITCPLSPTIPINSGVSDSGFTVNWTPTIVAGNASLINYTLEVYTDLAYTNPIQNSPFIVGLGLSQLVSGLNAFTTYYYRIKANNGSCDSNYLIGNCTTLVNPIAVTPTNPTICNGTSTTLIASSANSNYSYSWTPSTGLSVTTGSLVTANPSITTTYTVSGTDGNMNSSVLVTVIVNETPLNPIVSPVSATICNTTVKAITGTGYGETVTVVQGQGGLTTVANNGFSALGPNPFQDYFGGSKQQMLIRSSELIALGMVAGAKVTDLAIYLASSGATPLQNVFMKMQNTSIEFLTSSVVSTGWTTVYSNSSLVATAGINNLNLISPFIWDGTNLLIEINYSNANSGTSGFNSATYDASPFVSTWFYKQGNISSALMNGYNLAFGNADTYSARNKMQLKFHNVVAPIWSPITELFTDNSATTPYQNTALHTVFAIPLGSTIFQATITNSFGCSASSSSKITVIPNSVAGWVSSDQTICSDTVPSADLILNSSVGNVLKWQKSENPQFTSPIDIVSTNSTLSIATIGNLSQTTYFRAVVQSGSCEIVFSDYATILINSTTWDGSAWSNGFPDSTKAIVFTGNYNSVSNISGCTLQVSNNAIVTINSNHNVYLNGRITVDSGCSFIVNNNSNLLQSTTVSNIGNIIVKRNSNPLLRLDYTMWSSPVVGQKLLSFSPQTLLNRFYSYNPLTNIFNIVTSPETTNFNIGNGYLIRMPNNSSETTPTTWIGQFEGIPNNGNVNLSIVSDSYNAVGNPYPSTISADRFIIDNVVFDALYFWRKTNNTLTSSYATYTLAGGTSNLGGLSNIEPNGIIQIGQGFIFKSISSNLIFNNNMRLDNNINQFLRSNTIEKHRIWLNLAQENTLVNQLMIGYITGATDAVDSGIDGSFINDSPIALNSLLNNSEYNIQGRALPFMTTDVVPLTFKTNNANNYSITIDHVDGLFLNNQNIYIKDNFTNSIHNLTQSSYSFASTSGVFNNRFELVYNNSLLDVQSSILNENSVIVFKQNEQLNINTGNHLIKKIKVYDMRGRIIFEKEKINSKTFIIKEMNEVQQVLLVQVFTDDDKIWNKKIVY